MTTRSFQTIESGSKPERFIDERRRSLIKEQLFQKDEGALFRLANEFGIRHQEAKQQTKYDHELYLEWIFYWYVATINLRNRVVAKQREVEP